MDSRELLGKARRSDDPLELFDANELFQAMAERGGCFEGVLAETVADRVDGFETVAEVSDPDRPAPFASTISVKTPSGGVFVATSSQTEKLLVEVDGKAIMKALKEPVIDASSETGRTGPLHVKPKVYEFMVQELREVLE